jgi:hypothetical protein
VRCFALCPESLFLEVSVLAFHKIQEINLENLSIQIKFNVLQRKIGHFTFNTVLILIKIPLFIKFPQ